MAFISSAVNPLRQGTRAHRQCALVRAPLPRVARVQRISGPRMETDWGGPAPSSEVLGVGKEVTSTTFIATSVIALALGCYCVYASNLAHPLTASTVNPLYVAGSLLLPISWALHVAGWIQKQNNK